MDTIADGALAEIKGMWKKPSDTAIETTKAREMQAYKAMQQKPSNKVAKALKSEEKAEV